MEPLMIKNREDKCPICGYERSVELYDIDDRPLRFTFLLDSNQSYRIFDRKISHFQCKHCGEKFGIDWENKLIPRPLTKIKINDFMNRFTKDD